MVQLNDNYFIPSLDELDPSVYYLQNLPSIVCARVVDPKENEHVLDMCCCPGGKTLHLAALMNTKVKRFLDLYLIVILCFN